MEWLFENWYYIVFVVLAAVIVVYGCMTGKAKEWLKYAVSVAEQDLGTGTGQLKLREVYDMFITKFPVFAKIVPFNIFSGWVDLALKWMNGQLDKNAKLKTIIKGE